MIMSKKLSLSNVVVILIGAFSVLYFPIKALAQKPGATGVLMGFVYQEDLKKPLENAVVKIRNTKDGKEYESSPLDKNGMFAIKEIEEGRYILGISAGETDYNFDYELLVQSRETGRISLALKQGIIESPDYMNKKPALDAPPFFESTAGKAVLNTGIGQPVINCFRHPKPPKPPKSRSKPHDD
jgi:hypothetical protein